MRSFDEKKKRLDLGPGQRAELKTISCISHRLFHNYGVSCPFKQVDGSFGKMKEVCIIETRLYCIGIRPTEMYVWSTWSSRLYMSTIHRVISPQQGMQKNNANNFKTDARHRGQACSGPCKTQTLELVNPEPSNQRSDNVGQHSKHWVPYYWYSSDIKQ